MAARKLHMPGAQDRLGGSAGAVAEGLAQNGNGVYIQPVVETIYESRLAAPLMHPVPLASRFGGPRHDSWRPASAALQSTWIQRLRPASPEAPCSEFGQKVAHVWKDPEPPLWSSKALLLPGPSKEPLLDSHEEQNEADGGADLRLTVGGKAGASKNLPRNIDLNDKGKTKVQVHSPSSDELPIAVEELKNDNKNLLSGSGANVEYAKPPVVPGCSKDFIAGEGFPRRHGMDTPQEKKVVIPTPAPKSTCRNGESGALVTGFGSLRVVLKGPVGSLMMNKTVGTNAKLKGPLMEGAEAGDVPPAVNHFTVGSELVRVAHPAGPQVFTTLAQPGSSTQHKLTVPGSTRPGELRDGGLYPNLQSTGCPKENSGSFPMYQSHVPGKHSTFDYPACSNGYKSPGGFLPVTEDRPMGQSKNGWYSTFSAIGSGVYRANKASAAAHTLGPIQEEDGGTRREYPHEGKYQNRANGEASGKPSYGRNGIEASTARDVPAVGKWHADAGSSEQHASQMSAPFSPYQLPSKRPVPFLPARSPCWVEGEAPTGNDGGDAHQYQSGDAPSPSLLFAPPKSRQDDVEGLSAKPPWSFLFAAYKLPNQPGEPPNSNSSTGTLPLDGFPRANEGHVQRNNASSGPRGSFNQENESGGSARAGAQRAVSSAEARSLFDNQSSHFSSSPWPVDDGHNPTDDAGSASVTPSVQVPNAGHRFRYGQEQEKSRHKYDGGGSSMGGARDFSCKRAKNVTHSRSLSLGLRNSSGRMQGSGGPWSINEDHVSELPETSGQVPVSSFSGRKDDTSGSSPPLPVGCCKNTSDLRSPAFPNAALEDRGKSTALHLRTPNLGSERDGIHLGKIPQGLTSTHRGLHASNRDNCGPQAQVDVRQHSDPRNSDAGLRRDVEMQEAEPMIGDTFREVGSNSARPNGTGDFRHKHGRPRDPTDVGEASPPKRSRHYPSQRAADFQGGDSGAQPTGRENGAPTGKPSSWLSRWISSKSDTVGLGADANRQQTAAGSKEGQANGCGPSNAPAGRAGGRGGFTGERGFLGSSVGGQFSRREESGSDQWKNTRDLSSKRAVFGLPPYPTPSAAALALMGTVARKPGPLSSQRRGPIAVWHSVQMETTESPGTQKTVRNSELPKYV
ncbi:hypothetical protein R1sor_005082 [Riccia sorocarpa]|uniref:Uncharacterized protein n=1 Tax=Riccia sorocarpa TaxID=122646 RepID=A0ABD3HKR4_9MARC